MILGHSGLKATVSQVMGEMHRTDSDWIQTSAKAQVDCCNSVVPSWSMESLVIDAKILGDTTTQQKTTQAIVNCLAAETR